MKKGTIILYSLCGIFGVLVILAITTIFSKQCRVIRIPFTNEIIYTRSSYESICVLQTNIEADLTFQVYLPFVSIIDTHASDYTLTTPVTVSALDQKDLAVIDEVTFAQTGTKTQIAVDPSALTGDYNDTYPYGVYFPHIEAGWVARYNQTPKTLYLSSTTLANTEIDTGLDGYLKTLGTSLADLKGKYGVTLRYNDQSVKSVAD